MVRIKRKIMMLAAILIMGIATASSTNIGPRSLAVLALEPLSTPSSRVAAFNYQPLIIQIDDLDAIAKLKRMGVVIFHNREDLLLASVPYEKLSQVLKHKNVVNVEASLPASVSLDIARGYVNANQANQGIDLPAGYTGKGVVVGFTDCGFDATHIAFTGRLAEIHDYCAQWAEHRKATTPIEIALWKTDNIFDTHGTHVAGILCGGPADSPYPGIAYDAEIVATTSLLTHVGTLSGIEDVIAYAKKAGKRAVINMSISSFNGPHDGTDLYCQYLSRCAEDAVICLAAGNYGELNISGTYQFKEENDTARTMVFDRVGWSGLEMYGVTDIWGSNSNTLPARIEIVDNDEKEIVYATPWIENENLTLATGADSVFTQYFEGTVGLYCGLDSANNRYNVALSYKYNTDIYSSRGPWSRYRICIALKGQPGDKAYFYADGQYSFLSHITGITTVIPDSKQSISNMCTAKGVIAVGAIDSRNSMETTGDSTHVWSNSTGIVAPFTSYGNVFDGETLPHFCAPGRYIISAANTSYIESNQGDGLIAAEFDNNGRTNYWIPMGGTSMASPLAAGIIALWLEANPTLTTEEIIEIAQSTARTDFPDINNPRWGAGCIDAVAGLKKAIDKASITDVYVKPFVEVLPDRTLDITAPKGAEIRLYDFNGRQHNPQSQLERGIYILHCTGTEPVKVLVR